MSKTFQEYWKWGKLQREKVFKLAYLIFNMIYLSGIRPSWPLTEPFHQSFETCLNKVKVSPLWKLISRADLALKSYRAWASKVSDSVKKKKNVSKTIREKKSLGKKNKSTRYEIHLFFNLLPKRSKEKSRSSLSFSSLKTESVKKITWKCKDQSWT